MTFGITLAAKEAQGAVRAELGIIWWHGPVDFCRCTRCARFRELMREVYPTAFDTPGLFLAHRESYGGTE